MCVDAKELVKEKDSAKKGIKHSHKHNAKDASKLRAIHEEVNNMTEEEKETILEVGRVG